MNLKQKEEKDYLSSGGRERVRKRRRQKRVGEGRGLQQPVLEGLHLKRLRGRKSGFAVCCSSYHHSVGVKGGK